MRLSFALLAVVLISGLLYAADGATIMVQTVTFGGPTSGTFQLPPASVRYQKVLLNYTLRCPCDQYDRINGVALNVHHTNPDTTLHVEIFRYISPFGQPSPVGANGFTWTQDVSDFTPLLHDSVSISVSAATQ